MVKKSKKILRNRNIIIISVVVAIIISAIPQTLSNNGLIGDITLEKFSLLDFGFSTSAQTLETLNKYAELFDATSVTNQKCDLKMAVEIKTTTGQTSTLNSSWDSSGTGGGTGFQITFPTLEVLNNRGDLTYATYEPIVRIWCGILEDKNHNSVALTVKPNSDLRLKVYATDIDGTRKLVATHSLPYGELNNELELNTNGNYNEQDIASFGAKPFSTIDSKLSDNPTIYRSAVQFVLEGSITTGIRLVPIENKHVIDGVSGSMLIKIDKGTSVAVDGGGDSITMKDFSPKIFDNSVRTSRQLTAHVFLDKWSSSEGNPLMRVVSQNTGTAVSTWSTMTLERSDGINAYFKGIYRAPDTLPVGSYTIEVKSNTDAFGKVVRSNYGSPTIATGIFTVVDNTVPPLPTGCPSGQTIVNGVCVPSSGGTLVLCSDGVTKVASGQESTCPPLGGKYTTCPDGQTLVLKGQEHTCPATGGNDDNGGGQVTICEGNNSQLCQIYRLIFANDGSFNANNLRAIGNIALGIIVVVIVLAVLIKILQYVASRNSETYRY